MPDLFTTILAGATRMGQSGTFWTAMGAVAALLTTVISVSARRGDNNNKADATTEFHGSSGESPTTNFKAELAENKRSRPSKRTSDPL